MIITIEGTKGTNGVMVKRLPRSEYRSQPMVALCSYSFTESKESLAVVMTIEQAHKLGRALLRKKKRR